MDVFQDLVHPAILGVIQGLTEFLPVSSSGHLEIGKAILGMGEEQAGEGDGLMMTIVLHAATAFSTVVVFYKDIASIVRGLFSFRWNEDWQFAGKVVLSMIPAAIVGLKFKDQIEGLFDGNLLLVGFMLLLTGALLLLADRAKDTGKQVSYLNALVIGISQAIAILPGISRSGATISTGVLLGIDRMKAARFSFLMVIPLIFAANAKELLDASQEGTIGQLDFVPLTVGFLFAFVSGVLACKWMIALVKNCQLWWFSAYCFIVGAIAIAYSLTMAPATPA